MKVVYNYNYKDVIRITRTSDGEWSYHYVIVDLLNFVNKKRKKEGLEELRLSNGVDLFKLGQMLAFRANLLIEECKKSF